ncbi:MAG: hypothetical protein DF168_01427 [Candidatus Moanabacter tarae]|uniref:Uncharacterized protein n=1 Tax=Candidatus Moanibacter tarae TaxID=2200854 RepID=A0A2Z4AIK9_9BACT|nr:MAG: hypothetical protein DF168_01427 [Candidatus Moanabacter tarae]
MYRPNEKLRRALPSIANQKGSSIKIATLRGRKLIGQVKSATTYLETNKPPSALDLNLQNSERQKLCLGSRSGIGKYRYSATIRSGEL